MAVIRVLGSSSKGNGYVIDCGHERLVLEAGMPISDVLKATGYNIRSICGCLVTHRHDDHAKYVGEYAAAGISVLALEDVFESKNVSGRKLKSIVPGSGYALGGFMVQPLKAWHDVPCVSWVIFHKRLGRLVFVTDTCAFPYHIPKVTVWMIEANYSDDILDRKVDDGSITLARRRRLLQTHMEIGNTIKVLKANRYNRDINRMPMVDVILIHLSDENSDSAQFVKRVRKEARMNAVVADRGKNIDLNPVL